ncbi:MAG TPA: DUF5818 domain-containing protein [Terriglobales bacterium]|jgi:hypothetical protein
MNAFFIFGFLVAFSGPAFSQDSVIHEIPPAMNLLTEIPLAQAGGNALTAPQNQPAQNQDSQNQAQQNQAQPSHSQADAATLPQLETFVGTVAKGSDGYFLKGANGTSYRLEDAGKSQSYDGEKVQISGRLELDTNLIHVESIKPAQ